MRRLLLLCLPVVSACALGPRTDTFVPASRPAGALAEVSRGDARFTAELLAVTDTALLMLNTRARQIVLVPYTATTAVQFSQLPVTFTLHGGRVPAPELRDRLRLWSRFPPGVTAELLQRLLAAYGQNSLEVLPPCAAPDC